MDTKITKNAEETKNLGASFASKLVPGDVVLLFGDLGSGKTTFVQGIAKGLKIKDRILSPTFVLVRQYKIPHPNPLPEGEGKKESSQQARTINLYHVDLYRTEKQTDIIGLGLSEIIGEIDAITVIEWTEKLLNFKHDKGYAIRFENLGGDKREIVIESIRGIKGIRSIKGRR